MSVGSISSYGFSTVQPMNYAVENKSDFSQAFAESISKPAASSLGRVDASNPVRYANARSVRVDNTQRLAKAQEVSREYNDIAESFAGIQTGYSAQSAVMGYEMSGSNFDVYA